MITRDGSLLNGRVLIIALVHSLITLIWRSTSGTCSLAVVALLCVLSNSPVRELTVKSHLESTQKDSERTFGSIKQHFGCLVDPITIQEAHRIEQLFNGAAQWKSLIIGGLASGDINTSGDVSIIENDYSYTRAAH
jgi:hypothetical protein